MFEFIVVHHSATTSRLGREDHDGERLWVAIKRYHRNRWKKRFPWYVIDYHFGIGPTGKVFPGQPLSFPAWHTGDDWYNLRSIGVCFLGNFEEDLMPKKQFDAGLKLIFSLINRYKIPPENILRHKDIVRTLCPGRNFPFEKLILSLQGIGEA